MYFIKTILLLSIIFLFIGCSGKKYQLFQKKEYTTNHKLLDNSLNITPKKTSYKIKPHDRISLFFFNYPELSTTDTGIEVSESGEIRLPIIGKICVSGLSKYELKEILYQKYKPFLEKEPVFTLNILNQKVYVLGEVKRAGPIDYTKQSSLTPIKAIVESGGLSDYAARDKIIVIRGTQEHYKVFNLDLTDLDNIEKNNITLEPNDIVYVSHTKMRDFNIPLNGLNPSTALINTIFQSILLYKSF